MLFQRCYVKHFKIHLLSPDCLPNNEKIPKDQHWLNTAQTLEALNDGAAKFNIKSHTKFNAKVTRIEKCRDKGWKVYYQDVNGDNGKIREEMYDFILCATGSFRFPRMPVIPNMAAFKGIAIHSGQIRLEDVLFPGRKVLVVGGSFSGVDVATFALKNKAEKVISHIIFKQNNKF